MTARPAGAPGRGGPGAIVDLRDHRRPLRARRDAAADLRRLAHARQDEAGAALAAGRFAEARDLHDEARAHFARAAILERVDADAELAEIDDFLRRLETAR